VKAKTFERHQKLEVQQFQQVGQQSDLCYKENKGDSKQTFMLLSVIVLVIPFFSHEEFVALLGLRTVILSLVPQEFLSELQII